MGNKMRYKLYMFRCGLKLSQQAMANKIGCHRATYAGIEAAKYDGRMTFWNNLQSAFNLTAAEREELQSVEETKSNRATC